MDKKQQILNETYYLFSKKGYNLTMSDIAKAVNIKKPSLYSHFNNKEEIIELTIKEEIDHCFDTVFKEISKLECKNCEEKLKSIFWIIINYFQECDRLRFWRHIILLENLDNRNMSKILVQNRDSYLSKEIKNCFEKGIENNEIKKNINIGAIYLYFSMLQGILDTMLFHQDSNITIENFALITWDAYWNGIKQ